MNVAREPWGTTQEGEPVELFTLESDGVRARLASFGATLVALEVPDRHGERADVVLGFDTLAEYESPRNPHSGGLVGRCANRIAGARFTLDGREHVLAANEGRNHLHGGVQGFDRRCWTPRIVTGDALALHLRSLDGDEGYPGRLEVDAQYVVGPYGARGQVVVMRLGAHASAPTPVNLTQHAYFNLAGHGTILDHELQVFASRIVVVDDELLPTGVLADVEGTPFDFRAARRIGERIHALEATAARGYDVCYLLDGPPGAPAARLRDPASGRTLELSTDERGLQLYTGQRLDGLRGKGGRPIARFGGVCLETQGLLDAVHHPHFPSVVLRSGEVRTSTTVWGFTAS